MRGGVNAAQCRIPPPSGPVRVLVITDRAGTRAAAEQAVHALPFNCEFEYCSLHDGGLNGSVRVRPDAALLEISEPLAATIATARQLSARFPRLILLVLARAATPPEIVASRRAGANALLVSPLVAEDLAAALTASLAGRSWLSPPITQLLWDWFAGPWSPAACGVTAQIGKVRSPQRAGDAPDSAHNGGSGAKAAHCGERALPEQSPCGLTLREEQVLACAATRATAGEISIVLHLSTATVQRHLANIYHKLGVHTRQAALGRYFSAQPNRQPTCPKRNRSGPPGGPLRTRSERSGVRAGSPIRAGVNR